MKIQDFKNKYITLKYKYLELKKGGRDVDIANIKFDIPTNYKVEKQVEVKKPVEKQVKEEQEEEQVEEEQVEKEQVEEEQVEEEQVEEEQVEKEKVEAAEQSVKEEKVEAAEKSVKAEKVEAAEKSVKEKVEAAEKSVKEEQEVKEPVEEIQIQMLKEEIEKLKQKDENENENENENNTNVTKQLIESEEDVEKLYNLLKLENNENMRRVISEQIFYLVIQNQKINKKNIDDNTKSTKDNKEGINTANYW